MELAFTLSFSENQWICYADGFNTMADTLDDIDRSIENYLRTTYQTGTFKVKMYFDFDRFPQWHRQYMPHYFNRELTFELN